ncbi:MAG: hypothetical protein K2J39_11220 [Ruminococcus sp.]|nr:hypothetical protein [Ruminococcus sp.]
MEKHILSEFADILYADLSAGRVNEFINKKLAYGLRDIFTVFKYILKYAQEEYGFKLSLKNVVLPKTEKKHIEKISDIQLKKLISYLKENMSVTAFGILISLFMGLCIGELCGLKWSDAEFDNRILHIKRTVQHISSANDIRKTRIIISTPKSETSFRSVVVLDFLMEYFGKFRNEDDFFIMSGSDKVIEPHTMQYR